MPNHKRGRKVYRIYLTSENNIDIDFIKNEMVQNWTVGNFKKKTYIHLRIDLKIKNYTYAKYLHNYIFPSNRL